MTCSNSWHDVCGLRGCYQTPKCVKTIKFSQIGYTPTTPVLSLAADPACCTATTLHPPTPPFKKKLISDYLTDPRRSFHSFFIILKVYTKWLHPLQNVQMCWTKCKDKSNSACLWSPSSYPPVSLKGILSINIKVKFTVIPPSDVELCSKKLLLYENTGVPARLCMLITVALILHTFIVLLWYSGTRRKLMG